MKFVIDPHRIPNDHETRFEDRLDEARRAGQSVTNSELDTIDRDSLIAGLVEACAAKDVVLHRDSFWMDSVNVSPVPDADVSANTVVLKIRVQVRATGAVDQLPGDYIHETRHRQGFSELCASFDLYDDIDTAAIPSELQFGNDLSGARDVWLQRLSVAVAAANDVISTKRAELRGVVESIVGPMHERRAAFVAEASMAGIPLSPVKNSHLEIPLTPQLLTPATAARAVELGKPEPSLSAEIADDLVATIVAFSKALERMPRTANQLIGEDEESIRDVLLFLFNANWRGAATGETFLGGGKTDILLRWRDHDAFIGECKIWKGEQAFADGLTQLLERYTVWRATRVAMILFIRARKDITSVIEKAESTIHMHERFVGEARNAFEMRAQRDRARVVMLNLVPVVLPDHTLPA
ncbi:hypothetical protein [Microbacterium mangrovi]|uniref:hypothetical protein n=1 Tax=Microbacterium mangrovi TaxID=1348253 RepID=UPI00068D79F3|nr:hypothetical protein [Microbacterium mangrovi]